MSISETDLLSAGYSKDSVKLPDEYGGGYMASLEVNHQLHCLVCFLASWRQIDPDV